MEYFMMGGPLFMSILTLLLIGVVYAAFQRKAILKEFGLAALAFGFLGQLIGLLGAFEAIEAAGGVSQSILAGGLKVSSITSIYGLMIYCTSLSIRIVSRWND
jgi:hypothetical protein